MMSTHPVSGTQHTLLSLSVQCSGDTFEILSGFNHTRQKKVRILLATVYLLFRASTPNHPICGDSRVEFSITFKKKKKKKGVMTGFGGGVLYARVD